jgi:hypothetical protein
MDAAILHCDSEGGMPMAGGDIHFTSTFKLDSGQGLAESIQHDAASLVGTRLHIRMQVEESIRGLEGAGHAVFYL